MRFSTRILVIICSTVVAPLIIISILVSSSVKGYATEQNYSSLSDMASKIGSESEIFFALKRQTVKLISRNQIYEDTLAYIAEPAASRAGPSADAAALAAGESLAGQISTLSEARGAYLLNTQGSIVASSTMEKLGEPYLTNDVLADIEHADVFSSGILHDSTNKTYFYAVTAILHENQPIGYLAVEFNTTYFSDIARNTKVGNAGYVFFIDDSNQIFAHRYYERQIPVSAYNRINGLKDAMSKINAQRNTVSGNQQLGQLKYYYNSEVILEGSYYWLPDISGYLIIVRSADEILSSFKPVISTVNIIIAMISLFAFTAAVYFMASIKTPTIKILQSLDSLSEDKNYTFCDYKKKDELGWIATEVNHLSTIIANKTAELIEGEKRYRTALEAVSDIVWEYDVGTGKYTFMAKDKGMLGTRLVENVEIINCPWAYAADPVVEERRIDDFKKFVSGAARTYHEEYETRDIRGNTAWAESIATALKNKDDKIVKVIGSITDITQKKLYDIKVLHSAEYDKLTSIYNRATIEKKVKEELKENSKSALMMIDLDNFKKINDTFGHQFGDQILQFVSASICKVVTSQDLVGRIGGDEFIVFLKEYVSEEALEQKANEIVAALQSGYEKEGMTHRLSGSVGVAKAGVFGATTYRALHANADFAMYSAKHRGKNKYCLFSEALYKEKVKNDVVAEHLRDMSENNMLTLSLIPVWCNESENIVRFYADIDIVIPEYPELTREDINKIAAESNQQANLLEVTFRRVCRAVHAAQKDNNYNTSITFSVPVLALSNDTVLSVLTRVAEEEEIEQKSLEFAIDSKSINSFDKTAYAFIAGLRKIGTEIELLGFGGMYTSYNIVSDFHFDSVRFSDEVIRKAIHSRKHLSILKSMMEIARQTATGCTLCLTKTERTFLKDKLDDCFTFCTNEHISFEDFQEIIKTKRNLMNKFDCSNYKSRLLENTIMGL